jgi:hypothetical protein
MASHEPPSPAATDPEGPPSGLLLVVHVVDYEAESRLLVKRAVAPTTPSTLSIR